MLDVVLRFGSGSMSLNHRRTHINTHTHTHTHTQTKKRQLSRRSMKCSHSENAWLTLSGTRTPMYTCTRMPKSTHARARTRIHTHTYTYIHPHTPVLEHTHTRARARTHALTLTPPPNTHAVVPSLTAATSSSAASNDCWSASGSQFELI